MERVKGIEPSSQAWEARILPLNHTRCCLRVSVSDVKAFCNSRIVGCRGQFKFLRDAGTQFESSPENFELRGFSRAVGWITAWRLVGAGPRAAQEIDCITGITQRHESGRLGEASLPKQGRFFRKRGRDDSCRFASMNTPWHGSGLPGVDAPFVFHAERTTKDLPTDSQPPPKEGRLFCSHSLAIFHLQLKRTPLQGLQTKSWRTRPDNATRQSGTPVACSIISSTLATESLRRCS